MKWISSLCISLPFLYAITSGMELSEADQSFLTLVLLQTLASMCHRHVQFEFTLQLDRTIMCAIWLYVAFPVDWSYCILFSAFFCMSNTRVCQRFTYIVASVCVPMYVYHSEKLKPLKLFTVCSGFPWYFYNVKHDVQWTRWLWHGHVGLSLLYPLYLHDYLRRV